MKGLFSKIQGLWSFLVAIGVFWLAAPLIQELDPTAGVYDKGSLHGLLLGASAYLLCVWLAWFALQLEWPSIDKYIDDFNWLQDWRASSPAFRLSCFFCLWAVLFMGAVLCVLGWR